MVPSISKAILAMTALLSPASGLTAWWTELSPHMAKQDPTTGKILYSACHSNSTPIFPTDGSNAFKLRKLPRNGTSVAGAGWYDVEKKHTIASIFYQTQDGSIANGYFECNMETGLYTVKGEFDISATAKLTSIHPETGLAVELLGADNGYRLFFHDENKRVSALSYTTKTDWELVGRISQEEVPTMVLSSLHSGQMNMSVVFPKDAQNLEISRYYKDNTWRLATLPQPLANSSLTNETDTAGILLDSSQTPNFTLPAWSGATTNIAASVDSSYVRSIFYLGTDSKLHQISNIAWQWTVMPDQDQRLWPAPDEAGGPLAAVNNFATNEIWLYYSSNGSTVQLHHGSDGLWAQATVIQSSNTTQPAAEDPNESASSGPSATATATAEPMVLSVGAKAGIAVGVGVGVIALAGIGIVFFIRRRRQQVAVEEARLKEIEAFTRQTSFGNSENGAGVPGAGVYGAGTPVSAVEGPNEKFGTQLVEANAVDTVPPQELNTVSDRYELLGEGHWREMDATGQNGARRSIGGWREAQAARR
ncbi:hypothetical protein CPLU01_02197 [Colletotrichum plurivorum]|uniref:Fucose-specific lectin n=1 Tax=Colletotrichum plurivorum TaxID=2175906 RepID=A0A8H6KWF0_9PEZI|nr:hypothetical protein CPLU01_02197 [Colletotrichum plurivorum]